MSVGPVSGNTQSLVSMSVTPAETAEAPAKSEKAPVETTAEAPVQENPDVGNNVDISV